MKLAIADIHEAIGKYVHNLHDEQTGVDMSGTVASVETPHRSAYLRTVTFSDGTVATVSTGDVNPDGSRRARFIEPQGNEMFKPTHNYPEIPVEDIKGGDHIRAEWKNPYEYPFAREYVASHDRSGIMLDEPVKHYLMHRPTPPLPTGIGAVIKTGAGYILVQVNPGVWCTRTGSYTYQSADLSKNSFTVLSEGVEL